MKRLLILLCLAVSACALHAQSLNDIRINEVLVDNRTSYVDDHGNHVGWIELYNTGYSSVNIGGAYLTVKQGDATRTYRIPKNDARTQIAPQGYVIFFADSTSNRGTFHTNFLLEADKENWIGLYDSGRKLLDQVTIPAGLLKADQSYARVDDAAAEWEVKDESPDKYVTPSTNNKTLDKNVKMENFEQHDSVGIGMSVTAMLVVFVGLILLYISFKFIGKASVRLRTTRAMKAKGITDREEAKEKMLGHAPGEVYAAISMALHEMQSDVHDVEETVLTITRVKRSYSPWSSKIYTLRETPQHTPHKK